MMTLEEACKITRRASTAKAAAQSIVEKAYNRGMAKFERLKDDTTCVFASALCLIVPARSFLRAPVQIAYFDVCRLSCLAPRPRQVHGRRYQSVQAAVHQASGWRRWLLPADVRRSGPRRMPAACDGLAQLLNAASWRM